MNPRIKTILRPLASLYLTVPLLALSIILVFAGTLAQRIMGVDQVVSLYFRSWIALIDPRIFSTHVKMGQPLFGFIPFPGGKTLVVLLLANVLAAHAVRFKLTWKRSGVLLTHFALVLLLSGELITGGLISKFKAVEAQMTLQNGQAYNYAYDIHTPVIAVTDPSPADHDIITVIPPGRLKTGAVIKSPQLPFEIRVENYYPNADVLGPVQAQQANVPIRATAGEDHVLALQSVATNNGTDNSEKVDLPGAYVSLWRDGQSLGTYLLSAELLTNQKVDVAGKIYEIALRFERHYEPYTIKLLKFSHDRYLGSDEAKNFSSRVMLIDPSRHVDREVLIWMNHPLRYAGDTIYQQSFHGEDTTTLQIVSNPAGSFPYIAVLLGALGLLIHFGIKVITFLRRRSAATATTAASGAIAGGKGSSWQLAPTTLPMWRRPSFLLSSLVLVLAAIMVGDGAVRPLTAHPAGYDYAAFGRLPVVSDGRVLPYDSLARNTLRIVSGKDHYEQDGKTISAIQWLLEGFGGSQAWKDAKVIRIDHPDVISLLHLDSKEHMFSIAELMPHVPELAKQADMADQTESSQRDSFQSKMVQLAESWKLLNNVFGGFMNGTMYVVPPTGSGQKWKTLKDVVDQRQKGVEAPQAAILFTQIVSDYENAQAGSFNSDVTKYDQSLAANAPSILRKTHFESYLNAFDPFMLCIILYVGVLILGFISWLGWRKPLTMAALSLLVFAVLLQSFGLLSRIWLQGRPPVTNLYSSAVFIGWGAVVLCVLLELVYRNGVASVTAAVMGFVTLVIALHLQTDATLQPNGDTMAVMRAVLDTNLWLATHVVCITLGYASTFLAGTLAAVYVIRGVFTPSLDSDSRKNMARMIYAIVCFAMFFSFVGTILGGIWADQSWGRFWGWDPKENGAILIVLWNALILHARWCGMVRDRGMALLAIFGNVVTSWSWFGTNMLGIGLHSYGFMDAAVPWLLGFDGLNVGLILLGSLIPQRFWMSFRADPPPTARVAKA